MPGLNIYLVERVLSSMQTEFKQIVKDTKVVDEKFNTAIKDELAIFHKIIK